MALKQIRQTTDAEYRVVVSRQVRVNATIEANVLSAERRCFALLCARQIAHCSLINCARQLSAFISERKPFEVMVIMLMCTEKKGKATSDNF